MHLAIWNRCYCYFWRVGISVAPCETKNENLGFFSAHFLPHHSSPFPPSKLNTGGGGSRLTQKLCHYAAYLWRKSRRNRDVRQYTNFPPQKEVFFSCTAGFGEWWIDASWFGREIEGLWTRNWASTVWCQFPALFMQIFKVFGKKFAFWSCRVLCDGKIMLQEKRPKKTSHSKVITCFYVWLHQFSRKFCNILPVFFKKW